MPIGKADQSIKAGDLAPVTLIKIVAGATRVCETVYAKLDPVTFAGLPAEIEAGSLVRLEWFDSKWHIVSCEVP